MIMIRCAHASDASRILELVQRMADFDHPHWRSKLEIVSGDLRLVERYFAGELPEGDLFVAETPDATLGFILTEKRKDFFNLDSVLHVSVLAIDRGAEGRGIGRSLMSFAEDHARTSGIGTMSLNVFEQNVAARRLYDKLGYRREIISMTKKIE